MKTTITLIMIAIVSLNSYAGGGIGRDPHGKPTTKENFCATCHEMKAVFYEFKKSPHDNKATCTDCHLPYRGFNEASDLSRGNDTRGITKEWLGFKYWISKVKARPQMYEHLNDTFNTEDNENPERVEPLSNILTLDYKVLKILFSKFVKDKKEFIGKSVNIGRNVIGDIFLGRRPKNLPAFYGEGVISHDERHHGAEKAYQIFIDNNAKGCKECHSVSNMMRDDELNPFSKARHAKEILKRDKTQNCISCHTGLAHSVSGKHYDAELDEEKLGTEEYLRLRSELIED